MTKKKSTKKEGWKSMEAEVKRRKAKLKRRQDLKELLPEDIANDPKAVMEWLRRRRAQKTKAE